MSEVEKIGTFKGPLIEMVEHMIDELGERQIVAGIVTISVIPVDPSMVETHNESVAGTVGEPEEVIELWLDFVCRYVQANGGPAAAEKLIRNMPEFEKRIRDAADLYVEPGQASGRA